MKELSCSILLLSNKLLREHNHLQLLCMVTASTYGQLLCMVVLHLGQILHKGLLISITSCHGNQEVAMDSKCRGVSAWKGFTYEFFLLPSPSNSIVQSFESIVTAYAQEEVNMTIFRTDNVLFVAELVSWDWFNYGRYTHYSRPKNTELERTHN